MDRIKGPLWSSIWTPMFLLDASKKFSKLLVNYLSYSVFQNKTEIFLLFWSGHVQVTLLNVMGYFLGLFLIASKLIFLVYSAGAVKEVRETPLKRHQRFIEFYDVRDAAMALREMKGKEIYGKQVDIEFSRPGGYGKKFFDGRLSATSKNPFTTPVFEYSTTNVHHSQVATFVSPQPPPLPRRFSSGCSPSIVSPRSFLTETQSSAGKKPSGDPSEGNPNETSIEASLGCLSLGGDVIVGKVADRGPPKRSFNKCQNNQSVTSIKQQQKSAKSWKRSRQGRKLDGRFLISDDSTVETSGSDSRTTVMIKNIPNKYRLAFHSTSYN